MDDIIEERNLSERSEQAGESAPRELKQASSISAGPNVIIK